MLKEIFDLVKNVAGDAAVNNPKVPHKNNEVIAEATNTVASGLRNMVAGGGLESILSMFAGSNKNQNGDLSLASLSKNPLVQMMVGHFAGKLTSKYNMGGTQANHVANSLIPEVMENMISKSNDPNNQSFSLDKLIGSITGGKSIEVAQQTGGGGLLQDLLSGLQGGDGNSSLMDIVSQLASGAQEQQQKNGGGGLLDLIKGFMK